ncbi:putative MFS allantoate transporter protein [Coleophoma cylindrospora]|uniref:Putative MFS allantoate transporter protein n=1 Tax=Coleophoma cylindrospora TaxID=1849047 RepID=A0A3D8SE40_9HELO|nr:putative MFS allantoate transporter protein [Coleophoma cylindrospora]
MDADAKKVDAPADQLPISPVQSVNVGDVSDEKLISKDVDPALAITGGQVIDFTPEEERSVLSKIDWHIMPLMCWIYAIQFADKISLNYASLMGIRTDTHLNANSQEYSWVSSIFYAGYILFEFPTTYLLRRLPIAKYTSANVIIWGVVLSCHAAVSNYGALMTVRFFLGVFEATVTPAFVIITSMWYKQNEQGRRMGYWLCCNGATLILMAVIGYGLSGVTGAAIASWRILFLLLGPITAATGAFCMWFMPDNASSAKFLNERERLIAVERIRGNFQGVGNRTWKWYQFREAFRDPRTYLYILYSLMMNIPNGGITTFGSLIVNSFGFNARLSLLLGAPSGIFDTGGKLFFTWMSDKLLDRSLPAFIAILFPMVGGIMMITIPTTAKAGLLIGYYMISVSGASWGLVMVMISNNTVGYTKKATVSGLQILAYGAGNWIGPQTFRSSEAPDYPSGKLMVAIMYGLSAVILLVIRYVNWRENRRRDQLQAESGTTEVTIEVERAKFMDLTDFEQPHFRYIL